jgi:DNA-binding CsgD family transcriptional regulator
VSHNNVSQDLLGAPTLVAALLGAFAHNSAPSRPTQLEYFIHFWKSMIFLDENTTIFYRILFHTPTQIISSKNRQVLDFLEPKMLTISLFANLIDHLHLILIHITILNKKFGATNDYHLILHKIDNLFLFFSIFPLSPSQLFAPFPISFLGATNAYHLILLILRKFH